MWAGFAALALAAVAAVAVVASGVGDGRVELEDRSSGYLGDKTALSTEGARREANKLYAGNSESEKRLHRKFYAQHKLKHGLSAGAARQDLYSFFDTLGLNGNKKKKQVNRAKVDVHTRTVNKKTDARKTVVNVYIDANKAAQRKAKAAAPTKPSGVPVPLKAKKVQLAQQSKYQREMAEARKLLGGSKIQKALAQARTLSLKAEAPYYTS
uniref:Uncharacterized protein n=1 Tax=Hemiselmis tepida TaxID=464990 RepID=A0A7S0UYY3_9CRYP